MAKVISENDFSYALFGGGLLGFEIGAGLTARLDAGVTMEVTAVKVDDGKLVAERPVLQDSADRRRRLRRRARDHHRAPERVRRQGGRRRLGRGGRRRGRAVGVLEQGEDGHPRRAARRGRQHRGRRDPRRRRPRASARRATSSSPRSWPRRWAAPSPRPARWSTPAGIPYAAQIGQTGKTVAPKLYLARRHLRRDPAQGRDAELREHPRDQQGPERADLRVLRPRRSSATSTRSCRS